MDFGAYEDVSDRGASTQSSVPCTQELDVYRRKRRINFVDSQVAKNCHCVDPGDSMLLSPERGDGMTFGFAARMTSIGSLPEETFRQMFAVLSILESEDSPSDILSDRNVRVQTDAKSTKVLGATEPLVGLHNQAGTGGARKLFKMPISEIQREIAAMCDSAGGRELTSEYLSAGSGRKRFRNGRMYLTVHRVSFQDAEGAEQRLFAVVLWVVCHRNYDFAGKVKRLYGDPGRWRKQSVSTKMKKGIKGLPPIESAYMNWQKVILHQWKHQRIPEILRMAATRGDDDVFQRFLCDFDWESFASMSNPLGVCHTIHGMCPEGASDISVEGMETDVLDAAGFTRMQYLLRQRAWRTQFLRCKQAQQRELEKAKAAAKGGKKAGEAEDEAAVEEEEDGGDDVVMVDTDDIADEDTELFDVERVGTAGSSAFGMACLDRSVDEFDEGDVANLPYCPGWPVEFVLDEGRKAFADDIPHCKVRLAIDCKHLASHFHHLIEDFDSDDLRRQFGKLPANTLAILEEFTLDSERAGGIRLNIKDEDVEVGPLAQIEMYNEHTNPLAEYIYDNVYEPSRVAFSAYLREQGLGGNTLGFYSAYVEKMFHTMNTDLGAGKIPGLFFKSMHAYLESVGDTVPGQIATVLREQGGSARGGDFECARAKLGDFFATINYTNMRLGPQNLHLMMSLFLSRILWCCGTQGDWMWIGMPVQVCDAGGLTVMKTGGSTQAVVLPNFKKNGTCGFDFTVQTHTTLWMMYRHVVPPRVLASFDGRDCQDLNKVMTCTPGSIGDGMVTIVGKEILSYPADTTGQPMIFSEGMGDNQVTVIDKALRVTPRDDHPTYTLKSTADPDKTNIRSRMLSVGLPGFACTILAVAENQQGHPEITRRKLDFSRAMSNEFASGPSQRIAERPIRSFTCDGAYLHSGACTSGMQNAKAVGSTIFTDDECRRIAPLVACLPWVAMKASLMQKLGAVQWDLGDPVSYVLRCFLGKFGALLAPLISPLREEHVVRFYASAVSMGGVARTVWVRAAERCLHSGGRSAAEVVRSVVRTQRNDAVHFSLVPAVISRFLVSMLDFQTLAVMRVMFRLVGIPSVSTTSALELLRGFAVSAPGDRATLREFVDRSLQGGAFGRNNEIAQFSEEENMDDYVSVCGDQRRQSAMRMTFVAVQANNQDPLTFKRSKLAMNFTSLVKDMLVKYALFDRADPSTPINAALDRLMAEEYVFPGFFGGFDAVHDTRRVLRKLFADEARFAGCREGDRSQGVPMLRVLTLGDGEIAYGVHFTTAVFMQSLMGDAGCDAELQMNVAKSITVHFVGHVVPYSLLPVDEFVLDGFEQRSRVTEMVGRVDRRLRPLTMPRSSELVIPLLRENEQLIIEGGGEYGLYEDYAHMHSIVSMTRHVGGVDPTKLDLLRWEFDVWWGVPGDVTPLQPFYCPEPAGDANASLVPADGREAFVKVGPANELVLTVVDDDGRRSVAIEPVSGGNRLLAQRRLFAMGWGPAQHWRRPGVLLQAEDGTLSTLVPHNEHACTFADIVRGGIDSLQWFSERTATYLAQTSGHGGGRLHLTTNAVQRTIVKHKTRLLLRDSSPVVPVGSRFGPQGQRSGWLQVYLMSYNGKIPVIGVVPVVARGEIGDTHTFMAPLEDVRAPEDVDDFHASYRWIGEPMVLNVVG